MDLQLGFDDDDFENNQRSCDGDRHVPYNVKICKPQWFEYSENTETDSEELHNTLKFSADFHYAQKNFQTALEKYKEILDIVPTTNVSVRQDVKESLSRCYMYCGRTEESLRIAKDLVKEMSDEDVARQRQSLILFSSMCQAAGQWADCVDALEKLCCDQLHNETFWFLLGQAYLKVMTLPVSQNQSNNSCSIQSDHLLLSLTCFVRTRLLVSYSIPNCSELMRVRKEELLKKAKDEANKLSLPNEQKEFAYEFIRRGYKDIETSESETESESSDVPVSDIRADKKDVPCSRLFYNKFCTWMDHYQQHIKHDNT